MTHDAVGVIDILVLCGPTSSGPAQPLRTVWPIGFGNFEVTKPISIAIAKLKHGASDRHVT